MVGKHAKKERWQTRREMILQSVTEGICVVDREYQISFVNPAALRMLGWDETELLGKGVEILFGCSPATDQSKTEELLSPILFALLEGETSHVNAETFCRSDATTFLAEYICVPLRHKEEIVEAVITFKDITERRDLENAVESARQTALETAREKANFLANMSHEIRTPLNGIIGITDLLSATSLSNEQTKYLETLKTSANLLLDIVNDILDFSKIEVNKLELETVAFDLHKVIDETIRLFAVEAVKKGNRLRFEIKKEVATRLRGDAGRLRQILNNLVSNAIKFTENGEIFLKVKKQEDFLRFEISDTGIGIERNNQVKIFEPFMQSDVSTTRNFGGTGLGLAISRQLVTLMSGEIGVESEIGQGSTFWFTVKFDEQKEFENSSSLNLNAEMTGVYHHLNPNILVVEDNLINQEVALGRLRQLGIVADLAENGVEALKAVQEKHYDLILMDCRMPELDGFETTRQIRRLNGSTNNIKIVAMTASVTAEEREKCLQAGMDDYLSKPVTVEVFAETLNKHLEYEILPKTLDAEKNIGHHPFAQIIDSKSLANFLAIESRGEKDFVKEILEVYFQHSQSQLVELQNAFLARDGEKVKNKAHSLKGSSGNIGITKLFQAFEQLENEVSSGDWRRVEKTLDLILRDFAMIRNKVSDLTGFGDKNES